MSVWDFAEFFEDQTFPTCFFLFVKVIMYTNGEV